MAAVNLSPRAFLRAAFPAELLSPFETPLLAYPVSWMDDGVKREAYRHMPWSVRSNPFPARDVAWTYAISTVLQAEKLRRRSADLVNCFVIPCDDVGTKAKEPPIEPSYILETSEDNFQWGYFIDPYQVTDGSGQMDVDDLLLNLALNGYNDKGCRGAGRLVKLPGARHKSGFITRCVHWAPDNVWSLKDLIDEFDLPPIETNRRYRRARPTGLAIGDVLDPVYTWLIDKGLVTNTSRRERGEAGAVAVGVGVCKQWGAAGLGGGAVELFEVLPEGRRAMSVGDWLRGKGVAVGDLLGGENG